MGKYHLNKILREVRKQKKISQKELSKKAGVSLRSIYYWEKNEKNLTIETADKLFKALEISVNIKLGKDD